MQHPMEGAPWRVYIFSLARHLVDSASARPWGQSTDTEEKLRALRPVACFQRNREAIRSVRPHALASLIQRAIRL